METCTRFVDFVKFFQVLTVPMRNGNKSEYFSEKKGPIVLTVPMRNGNPVFVFSINTSNFSSYRTYEEWKLGAHVTSYPQVRVLTVPMRNGNMEYKITIPQ